MPKIICVDGAIEINEKLLMGIPFFEPMLSGGNFAKEEIEVEEDVETFKKVLLCFRDEFNAVLYENDYSVYTAYCVYACITPKRQFYISDSSTVHSIDENIIQNTYRIALPEFKEKFRRIPYSSEAIQGGLNWLTSLIKERITRPISPESARFLSECVLVPINGILSRYNFIICGNEVLVDNDENEFRGPFKRITKCEDPGVFVLLKRYIEDYTCIETDKFNWDLLKKFLEKNYSQSGRIAYYWKPSGYSTTLVSMPNGNCCCHRN